MDEKELAELTRDLSWQFFNRPFKHQVTYNNRLQTTGGRYLPSLKMIEINPKYVREMPREHVIGIIKHELCHYHLHLMGKNFKDSDPEFIQLLNQVGAPKFCEPLPSSYKRHVYRCEKCAMTYYRRRHVNVKRFKCGKCYGRIAYSHTTDSREINP